MSESQNLQNILTIEYENYKKTIILNNEVYSIGRHSSNSIMISRSTISRYHCTLLPVKYKNQNQQEVFWIIDGDLKGNRSANGLFINDNKCLSYELKSGDVIHIGGSDVKVTYEIINLDKAKDAIISSDYLTDYSIQENTYNTKTFLDLESQQTLISSDDNYDILIAEILYLLSNNKNNSRFPLAEVNLQGEITYVNQSFMDNFPKLREEYKKHPILNNLSSEMIGQEQKYLIRNIEYNKKNFTQYAHFIEEDKLIRSYLFNFNEKTQMEKALRESEERYRSVVRQISEGIILIDPLHKKVIEANNAYCSLLGYNSEEILRLTIYDLIAIDQEIIDSIISKVIKDRLNLIQESIHRRKDETLVNVEVSISMISYSAKEVICYAVRDITERKLSEEMLRYQACHDLLTDLGNRNLFKEQLYKEIAHCNRHHHYFAILFLDLDRFKNVNDTLGHDVGDKLLQSVAKRLNHCIRGGDLIARWGGDEFTILLSEIHLPEDASKIAQRILTKLKPPFDILEHQLYVKLSIGIAVYPEDGETPEILLKNADIALYRSKEEGGDTYKYYSKITTKKKDNLLTLEYHLHGALEKEEFYLNYQPQINIKTQKIEGMEALIRWENNILGRVSPDQFISLTEENGLIIPIGEWVLYTACRQNKIWQNMGLPPLKIAVNLSARQFQQSNLADTIAQILRETDLEPKYLELEITETSIIQNPDCVREIIEELNALGISIAMDDFGTGYSSLGYLKKFPFHTIKIDQSFVRNLKNDPQDLAIISAVVMLGNGFNLQVVAEGVETEEQLKLLQNLQCEKMQGYFFSKPLSTEDATIFLTSPLKYLNFII